MARVERREIMSAKRDYPTETFLPARGFVSGRGPGGGNPGGHEPCLPDSARIGEGCPTESTAWGNATMAADTRFGAADDADPLLRPAWEETPDETDADRR